MAFKVTMPAYVRGGGEPQRANAANLFILDLPCFLGAQSEIGRTKATIAIRNDDARDATNTPSGARAGNVFANRVRATVPTAPA
jgi:hypothetical protein